MRKESSVCLIVVTNKIEIARNWANQYRIDFSEWDVQDICNIEDQEISDFVNQKILKIEFPQNLIKNFK